MTEEHKIESPDFYRRNRELLESECELIELARDKEKHPQHYKDVTLLVMQINLLKDDIEKRDYEIEQYDETKYEIEQLLQKIQDKLEEYPGD